MIYSFDIETTCGDAERARVVEYALIGDNLNVQGRCNPGIPITAEATAVHGITNEMLADCLPFEPVARHIAFILKEPGTVLVGHSPYVLDIPVLAREFEIAQVKFDWSNLTIIDTAGLEAVAVPRKLSAIYQRMFMKPLDGAHGAATDAQACLEIFNEMRHRYADFRGKSETELAVISTHGKRPAEQFNKLVYDEQGRLCFNTSRNRGVPVLQDIDYAKWMLYRATFPEPVRQLLIAELQHGRDAQAAPEETTSEQRSFI